MMMYYKVVAHSEMTSAPLYLSARARHPHMLYYSEGKKTVPAIGKIFVFGNLIAARKFAEYNEFIFECEVENPEPLAQGPLCHYDIERFWNNRESVGITLLPSGTFGVDSCTLIRMIEGE